MIEIICKIIQNRDFKTKKRGNFVLVTHKSIKFMVHKRLLKKMCEQKSIYSTINVAKANKELIFYNV
tara:strand:- start:268 stop:468 length:201 start_codon:yes stop_codon:yes gene_type:complete